MSDFDEKMWIVIGPPGTGKTTYLSKLSKRFVEVYGEKSLMILSLTKAAAKEAAGRDTGLDENNIGTLHSACFRMLGCPKIVENKHLKDWNSTHPAFEMKAGLKGKAESEEISTGNDGDKYLQKLDLLRNRMVDPALWSPEIQRFAIKWQDWKSENELVDFTDLIERVSKDFKLPPKGISACLLDETQDFSTLEIQVIRNWEKVLDRVVLVGDPDQTLYEWRGSDPTIFNHEGMRQVKSESDEESSILLDFNDNRIGAVRRQSFRVPRLIHERSVRLIERIKDRPKIDYDPTSEEGELIFSDNSYNRFEPFLEEVIDCTLNNRRLLILASCEYMLLPAIKLLRENGIPYCNIYTDRWNPLSSNRKGITAKDRLLAYIHPKYDNSNRWSIRDIVLFCDVLRSEDLLNRGAKKYLDSIDVESEITYDEEQVFQLIHKLFKKEVIGDLAKLSIDWFSENLLSNVKETVKFPIKILDKFGFDVLKKESHPVMVGTIHSVKGGEADTVILFPDLSPVAYREMSGRGLGAVIRAMYVGMTRARRRLIIGTPANAFYIQL